MSTISVDKHELARGVFGLERNCFGNASPQTVLPTIHRVHIVPGEPVKVDQVFAGNRLVEVVADCSQFGPGRRCARTLQACVHPTYADQARTHVHIPD